MIAPRSARADLLAAAAVAAAAAVLAWWGSAVVGPEIRDRSWLDLWFQSDAPRVFENMTQRGSDHYRSNVHPLFSLIGYGAVLLLRRLLRLDPVSATRAFAALVAAGWAAALYLLLRLAGLRTGDAGLLALLGLGSGAAVLWLTVPETYPLGSLTLMLPLIALAVARARPLPAWGWVLASAASLSITVTNWMAGLAASLRSLGWRRATAVSGGALALVAGLWLAQRQYFPSTRFFVSQEEGEYLRRPTPARVARVAAVFAAGAVVIPRAVHASQSPHWLTVQRAAPGSGGAGAAAALAAWMVLLTLGLIEASRRWRGDALVQVALACLGGQLALHLLYGEETLLYALHWLPLLLLVAGLAFLGRARPLALALAAIVIVAGGSHNLRQLSVLADLAGSERDQVRRQMRLRPDDPWPRGADHVVLARAGSADTAKAYLEPGGGLSPAAGSFGISIWVRDSTGRLLTTSDRIPLDQVRQRFIWTTPTLPPPVVTTTPWYTARWSLERGWRLALHPAPGAWLELVVRSVGPAGGPVRRLEMSPGGLGVNRGYQLVADPMPRRVVLGDERDPRWVTRRSSPDSVWSDPGGWGVARLALAPGRETEVVVSGVPAGPPGPPVVPLPDLELPDSRFDLSLRAQVAHLLMGTVGDETRSADPLHAPIPWQRTGAYIIVALARAGQVQRARALAELMTREDYYGGFGAEADAPGLGIWALAEVAAETGDSAYDRRIWPAVRRKAMRILGFLEARDTVRVPVSTPIVPLYRHLPDIGVVAAPSRDGLVIGKMDHGWPLLYVNAMSYLGLTEAATLADRVGRPADAEAWRGHAGRIQEAWIRTFRGPDRDDEHTYMSALWPTGIAAGGEVRDLLLRGLAERRAARLDPVGNFRQLPLWTYFELAEAHQWLGLGRPDSAFSRLRWFWEHQASPGLYTWWEDSTENNSYRRWDRLRGWVRPATVTPHYWTSAEMLLLQLEMLARPQRGPAGESAILGAGIPRSWLAGPLAVRGLHLRGRVIDWSWDGRRVRVRLTGPPLALRPGPAFPPGTPVEIVRGAL